MAPLELQIADPERHARRSKLRLDANGVFAEEGLWARPGTSHSRERTFKPIHYACWLVMARDRRC